MTTPSVSFEFFPPKNLEASFRLWDTVQVLSPLAPRFVSVTYGAGGTTRDLTRDAVATLHKNAGLNVAAHLTCVNATREETLAIADSFAEAGVTEIVALRGDPPKGKGRFTPHPEGFANSVELIDGRNGKTGDETVFSRDLVAFAKLGNFLNELLHDMQLSRQRSNAHDRLQTVSKHLRINIHGKAANDADQGGGKDYGDDAVIDPDHPARPGRW